MAWVSIGSTNLVEGSSVRGYAYFEYDDTSSEPRSCRLRIAARSGYSFTVNFNNITVDGTNYGSRASLTQNSGTFWTGNISGGRNVTASWTNTWYAGTKTPSITGYLPSATVAPSGLDISVSDIKDTQVTFNVTLSSYGTPSSTDGRYIEAALLDTSTYGNPYRWSTVRNASSASITVSDSTASVSADRLNIIGNRRYYYGAFATNTQSHTQIVKGSLITRPAYITDVTVTDDGTGNMTISVQHANEGTADTVYTEYSSDQSNWTAVQDTFTLELHSATTLYIRRRNSTGSTPVRTVSIVPATTVKLYGSVNNQAKEIRKLYGSVNGQAVRIRKLYGSVNGRSKLIFVENINPWSSRGSGTAGDPYVISSSYGDSILW